MLNTLIGKKVGMTQVYHGDNVLVPVTVIQAGPCPVTQVKTTESDGYNAIQIGYGTRRESRLKAPQKGHYAKLGVTPPQTVREVRTAAAPSQKVGDVLDVSLFNAGEKVDVVATSKGRGFQGVMKRHGMSGQPATHGHMMHRRPGSIGMRQTPGRVFKNKPMPGHMGDRRRTVQNLEVVRVIADRHLLLVRGSVPGPNGAELLVRTAKKAPKA